VLIGAAPFQLAMQTRLLALLFSLVVLLPIAEKAGRGVVVCYVFSWLSAVWLGARDGVRSAVAARVELLDEFVVGFRSVLTLGVVLGSFLYAFSILHQLSFLPSQVRSHTMRKAKATS